ncbi:hypothetical protein FKP32DRAFT_1602689 [Trametes sanguinea]|nr:hypothetical protein FKP32DRAFT_1602689 [Trametes sanguinea]
MDNNWTDHFVTRNPGHLGTYWSCSLESQREQAVDPHIHSAWFDILEATIHNHNISAHGIYGSDELGFTTALGGAGHQQERQDCTGPDGSSIPPLVIFKGRAFLVQ